MTMTNSAAEPRDYGTGARLFHWVTAVLVTVQVAAGLAMTTEAIAALNDTLFILHKGLGCVFLPLMGLRLAWKLAHPVEALPAGAPAPQRRLAALTHNALYGLLFVLPVSGYLRTVGDDYPIELLDAPRHPAARQRHPGDRPRVDGGPRHCGVSAGGAGGRTPRGVGPPRPERAGRRAGAHLAAAAAGGEERA